MGEKGAVISKQQLSDEFLNDFHACEEMPKEMAVDAVLQVFFCLTEHDAEEDGEHCWGQNASLLDAVGDHCKLTQTEVVRTCRLAKTILQGTVKGGRRQGRQEKRREDNIREWIGLEFTKSQRAMENREKWRKLVVKSSAVPQQPLYLRDW